MWRGTAEKEPPVGIEPTTTRLRIESSTSELRWLVRGGNDEEFDLNSDRQSRQSRQSAGVAEE